MAKFICSDKEVTIIQTIASFYAPLYTFAYYSQEDIYQEVCIMCLEALPNYDPEKGTTLLTFLSHHVRNRLYNLRRDKFTRPLECTKNRELCKRGGDCESCPTFLSWQHRNMIKRQLAANIGVKDFDIEGDIVDDDLVDLKIALEKLDDHGKRLWLKFKGGGELSDDEFEELCILASPHAPSMKYKYFEP